MSKGVQCAKQTKSIRTIKNHTSTPSQQTWKHNHLKSSPWTSSRSYHHHRDTTPSSLSRITTAPKQCYSYPVTKLSQVKESRSCTYNTPTPTMAYPRG